MLPSRLVTALPLALLLGGCRPPQGRVLAVQPPLDGEIDDASMEVHGWFTTIQAAIDAASTGDTVTIPSGT